MAEETLPLDVVVSVLTAAAWAVNNLEDSDDGDTAELQRVQGVERDERAAEGHLQALTALIDRYCGEPDRSNGIEALASIEEMLLRRPGWLTHAADTWVAPRRRGGQPRADHQAFVEVVLGLHRRGWPVQRASHAVAALVDDVWANDPRARSRAYAKALWGAKTVDLDETTEQRRARLGEAIRQKTEERKSVEGIPTS